MNPRLEQEVMAVLRVITHAQNVFAGDITPAPPPAFAASPDIEDNLGRGYF